MVTKRKLGAFEEGQGDVVARPAAGTKTYTSGVAVREGLSSGSRQAFVALHQQIFTPHSALPLAITHPSVVILQHYHATSPTFDEIFNCWRESDKGRNERNVEAAVELLVQVLQILTPVPFFRSAVLAIVGRVIAQNEPYGDLSGKRDHVLLGLQLAAAAVNVDRPDASAGPSGSAGRLAAKVWQVLVDGGSAKVMGKLLGMRRRSKEGTVAYNPLKDPLDRPDIRHAALHLLLPLLSLPTLHAHAKTILPGLYNGLAGDPPVTIYRVLTAIWTAINGPSAGLSRKTALALLDENAIEKLLELVNREVVDPTTGKTVGEMTLAFLDVTTTIPGQGICFPDEGWYPRRGDRNEAGDEEDAKGAANVRDWREGRMRRGLHNRILSNVVRKLGARVVDDQGRIGDWVIRVLQACPEIVAGYWPHSALSLDPKLNPRWLATISYVGRITSLPPPPMSTFYEPLPKGAKGIDYTAMPPRSSPPTVAAMIESILPAPLTKVHLSKGLLHADHLVQHVSALALARGLQKLGQVHAIFRKIEEEIDQEPGTSNENPWMKRRLELEMECRRRVPEVHVVIAFAQKSATLARVPADSDDEPEPKLVAQSAMLTEVALRLFGLYHKTLPSVSREAKFDIGKLLVSASSAKAERREKREAREGSVISDSGSVGSVGTLGTVGMGGGFGQGRGDVDGFEAMSQVHVLSLLTEVRDWQWTNKASGSQYSYLYHILVLHLSTPHPITRQMTTSLLDRLLLKSIMFEHDHGELEIWLQALPSLAGVEDISQRAFLIAQQIHLLSFLDECVRRCMKTPYRYIEDTLTLVPDYFEPMTKPYQLVSPLMMVMFEQLRAKVFGELIATEAAGVVLGYLKRVVLGLCGKMKDGQWLSELVTRLELVVRDARSKGQERKGLLGSVQNIQAVLSTVFDGEQKEDSEAAAVTMIDEAFWAHGSIENALLRDFDASIVHSSIKSRSVDAIERYGSLSAHLYASTSAERYLGVVTQCLDLSKGSSGTRLRQFAFRNSAIKAATLPGGDAALHTAVIDALVGTLRLRDDALLAGEFVFELLEAMEKDKKGKKLPEILSGAYPWSRFFGNVEAKQAVEVVVKNAKRISESTERVQQTISDLITATDDPTFALGHLGVFTKINLLAPFVALLRTTSGRKGACQIDVDVGSQSIKRILDTDTAASYQLVRTLVDISPSASKSFLKLVEADSALLERAELLETFDIIVALPDVLSEEQGAVLANTAIDSTKRSASIEQSTAAKSILRGLATLSPDKTSSILLDVGMSAYNASFARLARELAGVENAEEGVRGLVRVGLLFLTRLASSSAKLEDSHLAMFSDLDSAVRMCKRVELDPDVVEPVIIAVMQDRLNTAEAVACCALLVERCMLKASFIRQQLSLLYSSSTYNALSSPSASLASPARTAFVQLLSALFTANPYISCQPAFVEQILPLYRGSLAVSDQQLLGMFHTFESYRHVSVSSVLSAWSAGAGRSSRAFEAITSLDLGKMFATAVTFPLRRALRGVHELTDNEAGQGLYDPSFVLALFGAMLREKLTGLDWVEVLRSNVLGVTIAALSSRDAEMRSMAGWLLSRTMTYLQTVAFQEKPQLQHTLRLVRYAIPAPTESTKQPRLPVIITTFLAHTLRSLASPSSPLYPISSRFLLQRPKLDAGDVPMLFGMLYASGEGHKRDRSWMVRFIKDSTRSEADWRLLKRRKTVELMQTLFSSSLDINFRRLVLQAMERITRIPPAVLSLVHRNHFIIWLDSQWMLSESSSNRGVEEERGLHMDILENIVIVLASRQREKAEKAREEGEVKGRQWQTKGREWIASIERLMAKGLFDAGELVAGYGVGCSALMTDAARLLQLVRIIQRFASIPFIPPVARFIPKLLDRLRHLHPEPAQDGVYRQLVEGLLDCALALPCAGEDKLKDDVEEIGWRAGLLEGEVGEWVRRERRLAAWESSKVVDV